MNKDMMQRPHLLVCHEVDRRWLRHRHKSFWRWILELGEIKPDAIKIIQTSDYNNEHRMCEGETVMKWRYDKIWLPIIVKKLKKLR